MRRINQRDDRVVREIKPQRERSTITADEVVAHLRAKKQWGRPGAKLGTLHVAVRSIGIAIEEICTGTTAPWGGTGMMPRGRREDY